MATKNELTLECEALAQKIAKKHGAKIVDKTITVGGKETASKAAEGGMFDMASARSLLLAALRKYEPQLVSILDQTATEKTGDDAE